MNRPRNRSKEHSWFWRFANESTVPYRDRGNNGKPLHHGGHWHGSRARKGRGPVLRRGHAKAHFNGRGQVRDYRSAPGCGGNLRCRPDGRQRRRPLSAQALCHRRGCRPDKRFCLGSARPQDRRLGAQHQPRRSWRPAANSARGDASGPRSPRGRSTIQSS
jgi:hypothetical protein